MLPHDESLGRQLPVQDDLFSGESGSGYVLRMTSVNGIPYGDFIASVASPGHRYLPSVAVGYVAYLFGADATRLRRAVPERYRSSGQNHIRFMGHELTRPYLVRSTRSQVCPQCLDEEGYAKAIWELSLSTVCTVHRVRLVDTCESCARSLSWRRPTLTECWCGLDFRTSKTEEVASVELEFNQLLLARLDDVMFRAEDRLLGALGTLGLNALLRLVWSAGIKSAMPKGTVVPGAVTRVPNSKLASLIVRSGLACLAAQVQQLPSSSEQVPWAGGDMVSDLAADEKRVIEQLLPNFLSQDGGKAAFSGQRSLFPSEGGAL